jgi:hypothetical protein
MMLSTRLGKYTELPGVLELDMNESKEALG